MSVEPANLAAIVLMAIVTYATRVAGYALLRRFRLGPRATAVLETVPGCVLVAVIAPALLTQGRADLLAGLVTLGLALVAPLLPTIVGAVLAAALLRAALG